MGNTADSADTAGPTEVMSGNDLGSTSLPADIPYSNLRDIRARNPEGHLAKLFEQAGVNIAEAELDALMQLPDDQFAEALRTLPQPQKPPIEVPAVLQPTAVTEAPSVAGPPVGSPEYPAAWSKHMRERPKAAPPAGFTVDPQDPTIFVAPDGRRFRALE